MILEGQFIVKVELIRAKRAAARPQDLAIPHDGWRVLPVPEYDLFPYPCQERIASVAESADAADLKSVDCEVVWVRVPPEAPTDEKRNDK